MVWFPKSLNEGKDHPLILLKSYGGGGKVLEIFWGAAFPNTVLSGNLFSASETDGYLLCHMGIKPIHLWIETPVL